MSLQFDEIFRPYVQYCVEQAECQKYCRERTAEGELFTVYLAVSVPHPATARSRMMTNSKTSAAKTARRHDVACFRCLPYRADPEISPAALPARDEILA